MARCRGWGGGWGFYIEAAAASEREHCFVAPECWMVDILQLVIVLILAGLSTLLYNVVSTGRKLCKTSAKWCKVARDDS